MTRPSSTPATSRPINRSNPEAGFTLVEVLVALSLITMLTAASIGAVGAATRALAHATEGARWTQSLALFDRTVRTAFGRFPPAFWGRPPVLDTGDGIYTIHDVSGASGYAVGFRFVEPAAGPRGTGGRILVVSFGSAKVAVPGIETIEFAPLRSGDGRLCGYRVGIGGREGESGQFVVAFGGQYL
ncbi:PulJ/GspJ family protein [Salinispira pacifica]